MSEYRWVLLNNEGLWNDSVQSHLDVHRFDRKRDGKCFVRPVMIHYYLAVDGPKWMVVPLTIIETLMGFHPCLLDIDATNVRHVG